jgi:predicted dehydrogenase
MEIRLGVVGCGYGKSVTIPAFRIDSRCRVTAIAAASLPNAQRAASELGIEHAYGDWRELVASPAVDAVAVAVPPHLQTDIVLGALQEHKPVFAEKPLAVHLADARALAEGATAAGVANMVDFNFTAIAAFARVREMLQQQAIGDLRHVVVSWQTESYTNRARLDNWKSTTEQGGGSLANFVSHCLHYLEWFAGPIAGLNARLFRLPDDPRLSDSAVGLALEFSSGVAGMLAMSAAAFPGSGHKIEFYGEAGSLVLENSSRDYMRGFRLLHGRRPGTEMALVAVNDQEEDVWKDGRILPASRLARQFFDWIEHGTPARPDFRDGLRVQELIAAAQCSHQDGRWVETGGT